MEGERDGAAAVGRDAAGALSPMWCGWGCFASSERLLLRIGAHTPLRAADALHVATAGALGARTLVTFDVRLGAAARAFGGLDVLGVS